MGVKLLDEHGFGLRMVSYGVEQLNTACCLHTWTLATHRAVRDAILVPDTPGGLRADMAWRPVSNSATAEAMMQAICGLVAKE
jgi:hypothetical protein